MIRMPEEDFYEIAIKEDKVEYEEPLLKPATDNHRKAVEAIGKLSNRIIFLVGPAGSMKTTIAVESALDYIKEDPNRKIIITRPMVTADRELGALPGSVAEKYSVWVNPILDIVQRRYGPRETSMMRRERKINFEPLNFIRGSSFHNHILILDEAQNTTQSQMKLFLTRMGRESKVIITGDLDQTDLNIDPKETGLYTAVDVLGDSNGIHISRFTADDIVRDDIIKTIVTAYEQRKGNK